MRQKESAIESDTGAIVRLVVGHVSKVPTHLVDIAIQRKATTVVDSLMHASGVTQADKERLTQYSSHNIRNNIIQRVEAIKRDESLKNLIPKYEEFPYSKVSIQEKLVQNLRNNKIEIGEAIQVLKAHNVHFKETECGDSCPQPEICVAFHETKIIIDDIIEKVGEEMEICKGATITIIGSIVENTRIGEADEMDAFIKLNDKFRSNFEFDEDTQGLILTDQVTNRDILQPYITKENKFDDSKFFDDFVNVTFKIIQQYQIPEDCPFSKEHLHLSTT